jgi:serine/threonine-protein kinase
MKIRTPVLTLIVGAVLAASLLVSSMSAVSAKKAALAAASASAAAAGPVPSAVASTSAAAVATRGATSASPSASSSASASTSPAAGFVIPPHGNYVGEVKGDLGSVAIAVHDTFAIAYFCNGKTQEAWLKGTPHGGKLSMTGNGGARLTASYALGHVRGTVLVNGISYVFSVVAVHRPSGLYESIADVRGATVKAGWIVLANGTQVGSLNPNLNAAHPTSQAAPKLNLSSLTADDGGVTLTATPVDGETGSGF